MVRVVLLTATLLLTWGVGSAPAASAGQSPKPPDVAALDQYIEAVPTSSGSRPVGVGGKRLPIPKAVESRIADSGGSDAGVLRAIVSEPAYGAQQQPQAAKPEPKAAKPKPKAEKRASARKQRARPLGSSAAVAVGRSHDPGIASAAFGSGGGGATTGWLIAGLVAITLVAVGARLVRR